MIINPSYAQITLTGLSTIMNYAQNPSRNVRIASDGNYTRFASGTSPDTGSTWTSSLLLNLSYSTSWQYNPVDDKIYAFDSSSSKNIRKISFTSSTATIDLANTLSRTYYGLFIDPFNSYIYLMTTTSGGDIYRIRMSDLSGEELVVSGVTFSYTSNYNDRSGFVLGNKLYWADAIGVYSLDLSSKIITTELSQNIGGQHCAPKLTFGTTASGRGNAMGFTRANYNNNIIYFYDLISPPNTPSNPSYITGIKDFGDAVNLSWTASQLPAQMDTSMLDVNKIFYEISYLADGVTNVVIENKLETTSFSYVINAGGSSSSKFAIRSYVLYQGSKLYSPYVYTNTFTTNPPPSDKVLPSALVFDGDTSYSINNRIIPITGPWTIEFSFKTVQSDGKLISIDNGTSHVIICQLNSGALNVIIDGVGGSLSNVNDNKIHHVGIVQSSGITNVYLDTVLKYTITRAVPTISPANVYLGTIGYNYNGKPKYNGIMSPPRFWNTARTTDQLKQYRSVIVPDNEPGLIDYMLMDSLTGLVKLKKNAYTVTTYGVSEWILLFVSLMDVNIPYPNYFQRKENIDYLRSKTNEFRLNNGFSSINWTNPVIIQGITPIKAVHWNEVEDAILEVYETIGQAIESPQVKEQLSNTILPKDLRFPIRDLQGRMVNIVKGLKNN